MEAFDEEVDVLIVGSGAAALTAAIVAADNRAKVALIEKGDQFGGTSATSGGVIWIPASHLAKAAGADDSPEEAASYITALAGDDAEPERISAFVENAPRMLAYMQERTEVRYASIPYTDYHAELPGGKMGWRSRWSPVHSENFTSATRRGCTHWTASLVGGGLAKGDVVVRSGCSSAYTCCSAA